ncbi:RHS repeat protein [Luteimonas aestuarii]|uniref:RHS repeat protein n=1 Tax=Luteimonas aestuarii TaxID=453837 RepID=UPI0014051BB3|nr:RHS repeat protein [Luteimonas aestuarii]
MSIPVGTAEATEPISYGEQVIGPQKHAVNIKALGPDLFGEEISSYTGGISFSQTDLSLPGNSSLPVSVMRRLVVDGNKSPSTNTDLSIWRGYAFGEWELDLPYLTGTYSEVDGWVVNTSNPNARCSSPTTYNQYRPNSITIGIVHFNNYSFWNGLQLNTPGGGEEQLLFRSSSGPLPMPSAGAWTALTTKSQWHFGCLPNLQSGQAGEGFLALAPDGTRYWLDWMVTYEDRPLRGSGHVPDCCGALPHRQDAELSRSVYRLYPTRVEDRFGNFVTYTWSGNSVTSITASDGRTISLTYSDGKIASATAGSRTVHYGYTDGLLTSVMLPDGSSWNFSTGAVVGLRRFVALTTDPFDYPMECQLMRSLAGTEAELTMTHPSGAHGVYRLGYNRLHRSNLNGSTGFCGAVNAPDGLPIRWLERQPLVPTRYDVLAVRRKTLSGPGLPANQSWQFQHQDTFQTKVPEGYPINGTRTVTTTRPDGSTVVEVFGTDALANEGQLLSREVREGSSVLTRQENTYVQTSQMGTMPFPDWMGEPLAYEYIRGRGDYNRPLISSQVQQQGASFFNTVTAFDVLARTTQTTERSELITPGVTSYSRTISTTYDDNLSAWVLGQVKQHSVNGVVAEAATYSPTSALPLTKSSFGKLQQTFTYNADGTLATVKDGNDNVIAVSDWFRGIPRMIQYPATPEAPGGSSQSATVDNNGWITSVTSETGNTTCYGYDAMGRLNRLAHPSETTFGACDDPLTELIVTWNPTTLLFDKAASAEYGVPAGHWRQTISTGNARKISYYDALWQPLLVREYDTANVAGTQRFTRFSYDHDGRTTFASYPGQSDALTSGTWTEYDALGRITSVSQDSELGVLTTLMAYESQFRTTTTNPRTASTTTRFKAYGQPSTDWPSQIVHPEGAITDIVRDDFGKPLSLTRRNNSGSLLVTRAYDYDNHHQLCRSLEPEIGATLMGYDGAGNLAWSAAGLSSTFGCADGFNAAVLARKVSRTYDARNRVASLTFPDGLGNTAYTYTKDGKQATLVTANGSGIDVTTTYGYKRRGQLASERQQWGSVDLTVGYTYDGNGALSAMATPGLIVGYSPNALGQATQAGSYATGVQYYPNGAIKQFTYGNGIVHSMAQNARQLPSRVIDSAGVLDNEYAYDANGNVQSILDGWDGNQNRTMTYDGLDRLLMASSPAFAASGGGQVHQFTYDVLDNLTSWTRAGAKDYAQYLYTNNRLTNIRNSGGATIVGLGYDAQGNLANKNGQTYSFDFGNRLRSATGKGTYAYDGLGRRVLDRTTADKHSLYSQAGQLLYENDLRSAKITNYVYLGGSLVARVVNSTAPATPSLSAPSFNATGSYTVSWTASSGATGYQLEEAVSGGAWAPAYSGAALSLAVTGKPAGNHGYRVRACLNAGCSAWSTTASVSVQYPPGIAPVLSAPGTAAGGNYTVTWTSIGGATEYRLQVAVNGGAWGAAYTGSALSQSYSGQTTGAYGYRVQACNPAGCGPYSATVPVQSVHAPSTAPALSVSPVGAQGNFTIGWTGVSGATNYSVDRSVNGSSWANVYNGPGTTLSYTSQPAGSYAFRVTACNADGCGPDSAVGTVQAIYAPMGTPSISVPAVGANGSYAVSWSSVGGADSYILERNFNGGAWSAVYSGAGTGQSYSGQAGGSYSLQVKGCNAAGCGPNSATGTVQVVYAPTSAPVVSTPSGNGTGSYTISWSSVSGAASYQLQEQVSGGGWSTIHNGAATSIGVTGRVPTTYGYRAVACNVAGCGPYSVTATTVVSYVPAVPTGLTGWKERDEQSQPAVTYWRVDWNASAGASYYDVEMKVGTGARSPLSSGPNTFVTGTGIGTRQYWVRACNSSGCSAWSNPYTL